MRFFIILCFAAAAFSARPGQPNAGISFRFKNQDILLTAPMRSDGQGPPASQAARNRLDTLSNWFDVRRHYVEIIRQDDPYHPTLGLALGFEFDEENGEYPYTPAHAVLQLKDFGWGGIEFSARDTSNYTGISDSVSDDITVQVDGYRNDTIFGRFSGLLLSGAGPMAQLESGTFRVKVFRR